MVTQEKSPPGTATGERFEKWLKMADLVLKGLLGLVVSGVIAYLGLAFQNRWHQVEQCHKVHQAVQESLAKQKDLDINLGLKMFETLMGQYLRVDSALNLADKARQQLLLLQLIALNFQDTPLNLKPLFQHLNEQLTDPALKEKLRSIAMEVANRQSFRLTLQNGLDYGRIVVRPGEVFPVPELASRLEIQV